VSAARQASFSPKRTSRAPTAPPGGAVRAGAGCDFFWGFFSSARPIAGSRPIISDATTSTRRSALPERGLV
jgi:hypothetical protein